MVRKKGGAAGAGPTTAATQGLVRAGIRFVPHVYEHDAAATDFGAEAARELGVVAARVFKTLMVATDTGFGIGIVSVRDQLDLKALAGTLGAKKASMADRAVAERKSGYVVGGISPIGQKTPLDTVLDDAALEFPRIFVSGGRRGFDIELAPLDLVAAVRGRVARIRRG
ncbi:aminoacyl-tRNA deacylase [Herbiconiux flava]|uniref:Cys-tRNA(Pro)/Cys-tRNA(Cys) deacylase n=1 Tax=Herbiconiux flava TaxID=881268 RepID=A0A852SN74_9MICO|nr:aminoacyl-tRNA deacylase [Herbiconiux flava]NYD70246.1 Cys-tRNA(Pro)/Cys-tRNA(Cys) deacylase [Herbiconiux flava]GLK16999.1 Cys-tRNA(Pro)/Cys-tRNA(Cys) deacylase [Herbiconiux flava]